MVLNPNDPDDLRGLIRESYRMQGITAAECRSIFLDWALGLPLGADVTQPVERLLATYADQPKDHPMTQTLLAALRSAGPAKRRGGRSARVAD